MRKRQRVFPCGRVIYYNETTPVDIGTQKGMQARLLKARKQLEPFVPYDEAGRVKSRWAGKVYNKFCTVLTDHLVSCLLSGDRIHTLNDHRWEVGKVDRISKHALWHSNGDNYAVVIRGISSKFGVRLSKKKRVELRDRIIAGQTYHGSN